MQQLLNDILLNIQSYYDNLVALLPRLIMAILVLIVLWTVARWARRFSAKRLTAQMDDPLLARFIARMIGTAIILMAVLIVLQIVGLSNVAIGLLSTAGVGAFVIGFAFKDIGENFLAGVVLAFNRPFRVGDVVKLNDTTGTVVTLNLRDIQIKTFDGKDVYIPNAMVVKNPVINYTIDGFLRQDFTVGLDYGSDVSEAMRIILATVATVPGVLAAPKGPSIAISDLAPSALNLTVYFWLDTFDKSLSGIAIKNQAVEQVLRALDGAGYYLPGNVMELKSYRDTQLKVGGGA